MVTHLPTCLLWTLLLQPRLQEGDLLICQAPSESQTQSLLSRAHASAVIPETSYQPGDTPGVPTNSSVNNYTAPAQASSSELQGRGSPPKELSLVTRESYKTYVMLWQASIPHTSELHTAVHLCLCTYTQLYIFRISLYQPDWF